MPLAEKPSIAVPRVTIDGTSDPLKPGGTADHARMFVGPHEHRVAPCGHNLPQERPDVFVAAILRVRDWSA